MHKYSNSRKSESLYLQTNLVNRRNVTTAELKDITNGGVLRYNIRRLIRLTGNRLANNRPLRNYRVPYTKLYVVLLTIAIARHICEYVYMENPLIVSWTPDQR